MYVCLVLHSELSPDLIRRLYAWHDKVPIKDKLAYQKAWKDKSGNPPVMRVSHFIPKEFEAEFNAALNLRFEPSDLY